MINFLLYFLMYELKAFPSAYFDIARKLSYGVKTDSSVMNILSILFSFLMMFGGIAFFVGAAIVILPLLLVFSIVAILSEYIQESIFPNYKLVIDIVAIPTLLLLVYYFGHIYLSFIFVPAFKFSLGIVLSILSIPSRYSG